MTEWRCPACRRTLEDDHPSDCCELGLAIDGDRFSYRWDRLLFERFGRRFLRNQVLNNNGAIAYWAGSGVSLESRDDVGRFRDFLEANGRVGRLLDQGCGPLPRPGYLPWDVPGYEFVGLDPLDEMTFDGVQVVGCSEFTPFPDDYFDTIVFGTSLDHVCSLDDTMREARHRLLKGQEDLAA